MGRAGEPAMSDLEFRRELSPEQIREALSLLDSTAGAQNQNSRIGDLSPAEEVNLEPDPSSTTMATEDRPPAAEDPQQRKKHLNVAVVFFGIGIAAAGALALLSWRESVPPPPMLGIAHEQPPTQSAAPAVTPAPASLMRGGGEMVLVVEDEPEVRGKMTRDPNVDPPPDLALEIEISRSALKRMRIYAGLRVPEVWRFNGEILQIHVLQPDGPLFPEGHAIASLGNSWTFLRSRREGLFRRWLPRTVLAGSGSLQ